MLIAWETGFVIVSASFDFWHIRAPFAPVLGFLLFALVFTLCIECLNLFGIAQKAKYPLLILFMTIFALSIVNGAKKPVVKNVTLHTKYKQLKGIKPDLLLILGDLSDGRTSGLRGVRRSRSDGSSGGQSKSRRAKSSKSDVKSTKTA